ncbi:MAG: UDP-N-acetylmuramoyl-tripeptide--D-alanyl-D-alanine ligase, partial [bacterium]
MKFKVEELQTLFPDKINSKNTVSISTDSRTIASGQIFLPLSGQNFDGHDFINSVLDKTESISSFCEKRKLHKVNEKHKNNLILVESTLDSYHKLANFYRKKINPKVIVVTGSSGKTTVKDLIYTVLSEKYKTHKTEANYNNEFGVPKTILEMPEDTQVLVLELAMRAKGEIRYLSKTAEPDIAIITSVGTAHIGILGSVEEIIKAKCEILEHLNSKGLAILPNNSKLVEYSKSTWKGKSFIFDNTAESTQVINSTIVSKVASELGMSQAEIQSGLSSFK